MRVALLAVLALLPALWSPPVLAAADPLRGKTLHDKQCVNCHAKRYGGDGTQIYLRPDRQVRDRQSLAQRVATCNAMLAAGLFPEDEADIVAYLAQRYYKFDK